MANHGQKKTEAAASEKTPWYGVFQLIQHDGADRFTALHQVETLVDIVELQTMRDQVVNVELAFHIPVDDLRHVRAAARAAKGGTLPYTPRHQLEWTGGNFLARRRHADDDGLAPALVAALERLAHGGGVAYAFKRIIGAAVRQLHDGVDHIIHFVGVDKMRHAELARDGLARRVDVDADNLVRADHLGCLDHVQADAAQAEYDHVGARLHLGREQYGAHARRHAATDVADFVERRVFTDLGQGNFGHDDIVRESGRAHIVEDGLTVDGKARGGVRHQATALGRADRLAQVRFLRQAELALAAFRRVQGNDVVILFQAFHARAHVDDDAGAFMAEDGREDAFRVGARQGVVIGVANARGLDFDQYFALARAGQVDFFDGQRRARLPCNRCFGFHVCPVYG